MRNIDLKFFKECNILSKVLINNIYISFDKDIYILDKQGITNDEYIKNILLVLDLPIQKAYLILSAKELNDDNIMKIINEDGFKIELPLSQKQIQVLQNKSIRNKFNEYNIY